MRALLTRASRRVLLPTKRLKPLAPAGLPAGAAVVTWLASAFHPVCCAGVSDRQSWARLPTAARLAYWLRLRGWRRVVLARSWIPARPALPTTPPVFPLPGNIVSSCMAAHLGDGQRCGHGDAEAAVRCCHVEGVRAGGDRCAGYGEGVGGADSLGVDGK